MNTNGWKRLGLVAPFLGTALIWAPPAAAQCTPQEAAVLTSGDLASLDEFGYAVAASGDTVVVGVRLDDDAGNASGSAYVFERDHDGPDQWGQAAKLTASDAAADDQFGISVAISGDTVVVGAWLDDDNGIASGSAYVFERDQGGLNAWGQVAKLAPTFGQALDLFGQAVAVSGDTAAVGAHFDDTWGPNAGAVYVFERDWGGPDSWGERKTILAPGGAALDEFGISVSLSGDTLVAGAHRDDDSGAESGSAHVFDRDQGGVNNWGQVAKLTASNSAANDEFGLSASISGDTVVVGARWHDGAGQDSGSAYVFDRDQGGANAWGEVAELTALDAAAFDRMGYVAVEGDVALVGAPGSHFGGAAYVFGRDQDGADQWGQMTKFTPSSAGAGDEFGVALALSGGMAIVGAPENDAGGSQAGTAYVLDGLSQQAAPQAIATLLPSDATPNTELFGHSGDLWNDTAVVGATFHSHGFSTPGAVYVFQRDHGGVNQWGEVAELLASDGASADFLGEDVAISGDRVVAGAHWADHSGVSNPGSAYIFERDHGGADQWGEAAKLIASDPSMNAWFGEAVAISGDTAVVGSWGANAAYVFERDQGGSNNWGQVTKLAASGEFGQSVAIVGDTLLVGAPRNDNAGGNDAGAVYVFERDQGGADAWGQVHVILASEGSSFDHFGLDVVLSVDTALVGAPQDGPAGFRSGSAYLFDRDHGGASNWGEIKKLVASDGSTDHYFGQELALYEETALVGAPENDSVYLFARNHGIGDHWGEVCRLTGEDEFGSAVALHGDAGLVGAERDKSSVPAGAAYVFDPMLSAPPTTYCTAGTSASGCQAMISASGTPSASAPSGFDLIATGVEGNKNGLFFFGTNGRQANSWGNGTSLQCVVPPVKRGPLIAGGGTSGSCDGQFVSDLNTRWTTNPNQNPGAGALVQAQLWYRDPLNTSNQSTSLSDAIEFSVCPELYKGECVRTVAHRALLHR